MALPPSPFLGLTGIVGPVYRVDPSSNSPLLDDSTGLPVVLDASGFYFVRVRDFDLVSQRCKLEIIPYQSRAKFIKNPGKSSYGGFSISYVIDNRDQVLDGGGNLVTAGTFSTYFSLDSIRGNNKSEYDRAIELVMTLNGTSVFQNTFPVNFSTMSTSNINQNQINNALS